MTRSDDEVLVGNEVDRCLEEAGNHLHAYGGSPIDHQTGRAQYHLARVQLLDRLGTTRAAQYLRKELLDAIANDRRDGDSATLKAMGFDRRTQDITTTKVSPGSSPYGTPDPSVVISGGPGVTYQSLVGMYEQMLTESVRYNWPRQ